MKLNLDKNLLNLNGEPLKEKLNDIMANVLIMATVGKPAKMVTWAVNLTNNGEIEVNNDDIQFLIKVIEQSPHVINLAKAQLIDELKKLEAQG